LLTGELKQHSDKPQDLFTTRDNVLLGCHRIGNSLPAVTAIAFLTAPPPIVLMFRYSRILSVLGEDGLKKIRDSSVLVTGAGGLGSAVIAYLAGCGVGKLGIADGDVVELHNLDRQIIHSGNLGKNKAESAKEFVERLNPDVDVLTFGELNEENGEHIIKNFDVIVSCVDSFAARFFLNDICLKERKPLVHGAIAGFEGELMVFDFRKEEWPCYRCIYPGKYEEKEFPALPPVAGAVGCLQAIETIKLICNLEVKPELLRIDFRYMEFVKLNVSKRKDCICSRKSGY